MSEERPMTEAGLKEHFESLSAKDATEAFKSQMADAEKTLKEALENPGSVVYPRTTEGSPLIDLQDVPERAHTPQEGDVFVRHPDGSLSIENLTADRGSQYGHPLVHFDATGALDEVLCFHMARCEAVEKLPVMQQRAIHHGTYMILDKLVRAMTSPMKEDNWDDIMGYARTVKMALGMVPDALPPNGLYPAKTFLGDDHPS